MRPIDADALKDELMYLPGGYAQSFAGKACLMAIDDTPTLDYAPVRHGEWIEKIEPYAYTATGREIHIFHCSVCDFTWANKRMVFDHFKHCPNCGAKMDGGKSHEY